MRQAACVLLLALLLTPPALATDVVVRGGWLRESPPLQPTGVAYVYLQNTGTACRTLLRVESAIAERAEVHRHDMVDGMMRMRRVDALRLDAGELLRFGPGGYHLMLYGLRAGLAAGQRVEFRFAFDDGSVIAATVPVLRIGEERAYIQKLRESMRAEEPD